MSDIAIGSRETAQISRNRIRKLAFTILFGAIGLAVVGVGVHWFLVGRNYVSTDDAYVDASNAQITPLVSAAIVKLPVVETQRVKAGDVLVVLDDSDFKLALAQAQAQLGQTERKVQGYFSNDDALAAQINARDADIVAARARIASADSDLQRAKIDFDRRQALASSGAVSGDELTTAQNRLRQSEAALASMRAALAQSEAQKVAAVGARKINAALIEGTTLDTNPEVLAARAAADKAKLDLDRTVIRAPIDGVVTRNTVQIGQRVQSGASLMTLVPLDQVYVNANFKEVQLDRVIIGQKAELTSDLYGRGVVFHGTVVGLAGGTGAAFALIPAQNATGNWIKVVQRLPVRIELDPRDLQQHPLRVGLSMNATIDLASK